MFSGGTPVAITNCLNFGNPYNPEVYWQFVHALKGMGEACLKFDTPVTGETSVLDQTQSHGKTKPVYPTPPIGMLGILDDASLMTTLEFKQEGHLIYLLGHQNNHIGYSEYVNIIHGIAYCPAFLQYVKKNTDYIILSELVLLTNGSHQLMMFLKEVFLYLLRNRQWPLN